MLRLPPHLYFVKYQMFVSTTICKADFQWEIEKQ